MEPRSQPALALSQISSATTSFLRYSSAASCKFDGFLFRESGLSRCKQASALT